MLLRCGCDGCDEILMSYDVVVMGCDVVAPKITCWMFKVEFMYDPVY